MRASTRVDVRVTSRIDWFGVEGVIVFDDVAVPLPEVLRALERGAPSVRLGDGSTGLLPQEWLGRHGLALSFGEEAGRALRFRRTHLGLLDDLLEALPPANVDEVVRVPGRSRGRWTASGPPTRPAASAARRDRPDYRASTSYT